MINNSIMIDKSLKMIDKILIISMDFIIHKIQITNINKKEKIILNFLNLVISLEKITLNLVNLLIQNQQTKMKIKKIKIMTGLKEIIMIKINKEIIINRIIEYNFMK